jgi:hypothetical protein
VAPILPPLMAPQQPSWKQEVRQDTPGAEGAPEAKPAADENNPGSEQKPEGSGENQ